MARPIYLNLLIISLTLLTPKIKAQSYSAAPTFEIGMDIGGLVSLSPLTPYGKFGGWKQLSVPSIDFFIEHPLVGPLSLKGKIFIGKFGVDDSKTKGYSSWGWLSEYRKLKFETTVKEISGTVVFNLFGGNNEAGNPHKFSVYFFAGAGIAFVNVTRDWSNFNTAYFLVNNPSLVANLAKDTMQTLPKTAIIMPLGGGLKYALSSQFSLLLESNFRYTKQQFLDGFHNVGSNQIGEAYNQKKDDYYYGGTVGISYKLNAANRKSSSRLECPKIVF